MASPNICFMDLAAQTGICVGRLGEHPRLGSIELKGDTRARRMAYLWDVIDRIVRGNDPFDQVWIEAALPSAFIKGKTIQATIANLNGYIAVAEAAWLTLGKIEPRTIDVQSVRRHFIGGFGFLYRGQMMIGSGTTPREPAKFATMERSRVLGIEPADDNAADAYAGWSWAQARHNPTWAATQGTLIGG